MPFNEELPRWEAPGVEPPDSKKAEGWQATEKPPADYFNWLFERTYRALEELQAKAAEMGIVGGYGVATQPTANAYAVTINPGPAELVPGMRVSVRVEDENTGSASLNINGLGTRPIRKPNGKTLTSGNLKAGGVYTLVYDGQAFILQGEGGGEIGTATAPDVLAGRTFGGEDGLVVGTMPDQLGRTVKPTNRAPYNGNLDIKIPPGAYSEQSTINIDDPNFHTKNVPAGKTIFGLPGYFAPRIPNLISNGSFENDLNNWERAGSPNVQLGGRFGEKVCGLQSIGGNSYTAIQKRFEIIQGRKYYARVYVYADDFTGEHNGEGQCDIINLPNGEERDFFTINRGTVPLRQWKLMSGIITAPYSTMGTFRIYSFNTSHITIDGVMLFDLSEAFGTGNEPTKEEMDRYVEAAGHYWESEIWRLTEDAILDPQFLLQGSSGYDDGTLKHGTMPNLTGIRMATGAARWPDGGLAVYPEKGYQKGGPGDGEIKVSPEQLRAAEPSLVPQHILGGATIFGVAGGIINRSTENFHMPGVDYTTWAGDRFFIQPPKGYYDGGSWVTAPVPELRPENIRAGRWIGTVQGTLQPLNGDVYSIATFMSLWGQNNINGMPYIDGDGSIYHCIDRGSGFRFEKYDKHGTKLLDIFIRLTSYGWTFYGQTITGEGYFFMNVMDGIEMRDFNGTLLTKLPRNQYVGDAKDIVYFNPSNAFVFAVNNIYRVHDMTKMTNYYDGVIHSIPNGFITPTRAVASYSQSSNGAVYVASLYWNGSTWVQDINFPIGSGGKLQMLQGLFHTLGKRKP